MLAGLDQLAEVAALVCHPGGAPIAPAAVPRFPGVAVPSNGEAGAATDVAPVLGSEEGVAAAVTTDDAGDGTNIDGGLSAPRAAGIADKFAAAMKGANAARKSSDNVKLRVSRCVCCLSLDHSFSAEVLLPETNCLQFHLTDHIFVVCVCCKLICDVPPADFPRLLVVSYPTCLPLV